MKFPTPSQLDRWLRSNFPRLAAETVNVRCCFCDREDSWSIIQPLHPAWLESESRYAGIRATPHTDDHFYRCVHGPCWQQREDARQAERKAELDKMPKCEICGIRRASWKVANIAVCGFDKAKLLGRVNRQIANSGLGGLAAFGDIGQRALLRQVAEDLKRNYDTVVEDAIVEIRA